MKVQPKWKWILSISISFIVFPSTIFLFAGGINIASKPGLPLYRSGDEIDAFSYLSDETESGSVILTSYNTGNPLPAWAPLTVVVGHGSESADLAQSLSDVENFYNLKACHTTCLDFLNDNKVRYVLWGPEERKLGYGIPDLIDISDLVYSQGNYRIYELK